MLNKCIYSRARHKQGKLYWYCTKTRENVEKTCYIGCFDKEYKILTKLKQKTNKQQQLENSRYSIVQKNKSKCYFCSNKAIDHHELIKGRNRKNCIKWGLVVYLCRECHRRTEEDSKFYKETREMAQKIWQDYYNKSEEEFIKEFGRSYLK